MKLIYFIIVTLFAASCSDEVKIESSVNYRPAQLPFPPIKNFELSKKDKQKLDAPAIKSKFVKINPGEFMMGSKKQEDGRDNDEALHKVQISEIFYISKFETTVREWNALAPMKQYNLFRLKNSEKELIKPLYNTLLNHPSFKKELPSFMKEDVEKVILPEEGSGNLFGLKSMINLVDYWNKLGQNFKKKIAGDLTLSVSEYSSLLNTLVDNQNQLPINQISYTQAVAYCHKLTEEACKTDSIPEKMNDMADAKMSRIIFIKTIPDYFVSRLTINSFTRRSSAETTVNSSEQYFKDSPVFGTTSFNDATSPPMVSTSGTAFSSGTTF